MSSDTRPMRESDHFSPVDKEDNHMVVTLSCGHKLATMKRERFYACRECPPEPRSDTGIPAPTPEDLKKLDRLKDIYFFAGSREALGENKSNDSTFTVINSWMACAESLIRLLHAERQRADEVQQRLHVREVIDRCEELSQQVAALRAAAETRRYYLAEIAVLCEQAEDAVTAREAGRIARQALSDQSS